MDIHTAFDDQGQCVQSKGFDYEAIDGVDLDDLADLTPQNIEMAAKMFRALLCWIWQNPGDMFKPCKNGKKRLKRANENGLRIRCIIACWIFLEELRPLSLTQLAKRFGKHKQSFGRWVKQFKTAFPQIKTPHMKHTTQTKRKICTLRQAH